MKLSQRAMIHADKMDEEGWYVTANVLAACAEALDDLEQESRNLTAILDYMERTSARQFDPQHVISLIALVRDRLGAVR